MHVDTNQIYVVVVGSCTKKIHTHFLYGCCCCIWLGFNELFKLMQMFCPCGIALYNHPRYGKLLAVRERERVGIHYHSKEKIMRESMDLAA